MDEYVVYRERSRYSKSILIVQYIRVYVCIALYSVNVFEIFELKEKKNGNNMVLLYLYISGTTNEYYLCIISFFEWPRVLY